MSHMNNFLKFQKFKKKNSVDTTGPLKYGSAARSYDPQVYKKTNLINLRQAPLCLIVICFCCSQLNFLSSHSLAQLTESLPQTGPSVSRLWPFFGCCGVLNDPFVELNDLVRVHVGHSHVIFSTPFRNASKHIPSQISHRLVIRI